MHRLQSYRSGSRGEPRACHQLCEEVWGGIEEDRAGKKVLGFTLGGRSEETGVKLYKSLSGLQISSYDTDYWAACGGILHVEHPIQSKAATYTVESRNSLMRYYLALFRRRGRYIPSLWPWWHTR